MSQEFEKTVLEKLNNFEGRFDRIEKTLYEHTEILNDHTKTLNEHTEQFQKVRKDIYETNNKVIKNGIKMDEMELVIEYNTETIKKFNQENRKRIDIALKACEKLKGDFEFNKCSVMAFKSKNFENEIRISALEDAIKLKGLMA